MIPKTFPYHTTAMPSLTVDEVRAHPGFPTAIIPQKADLKGWGPAGVDRGSPFNIACELFCAYQSDES